MSHDIRICIEATGLLKVITSYIFMFRAMTARYCKLLCLQAISYSFATNQLVRSVYVVMHNKNSRIFMNMLINILNKVNLSNEQ